MYTRACVQRSEKDANCLALLLATLSPLDFLTEPTCRLAGSNPSNRPVSTLPLRDETTGTEPRLAFNFNTWDLNLVLYTASTLTD